MLDTELWDVDGLPWPLRRWQLFLYKRNESNWSKILTEIHCNNFLSTHFQKTMGI